MPSFLLYGDGTISQPGDLRDRLFFLPDVATCDIKTEYILREISGNDSDFENKLSVTANTGEMSVALDQESFSFEVFYEVHDIEGGVLATSNPFTVGVYEDYCTSAMRCKSPTT